MGTARLDSAYEGTGFAGWAAQPGLRTVQGELESGLERIFGQRVELTVAGRTDAGVHAAGQVASFEHGAELPDRLAERLNAVLADDLAVRAAEPAADGFDARRQARSRCYRYRVLASPIRDPFERGRALWWRSPVERGLLDECAAATVGTHDFTAFTPTQSEHVLFERTVLRAQWRAEHHARPDLAGGGDEASQPGDGMLVFEIEAPSFMRNQVRVIVGTRLEVGAGRRSPADFRALLGGAARERAGETAPAHGLCLVAVRY